MILNKRIIILGDNSVGKSTLLIKLTKKRIETRYKQTFGVDFFLHELTYFNQKINLNIWDTEGEEDIYQILDKRFYRESNAFIIICSYDDKSSILSINKWYDYIKIQYQCLELLENIPIIVVVNKSEIECSSREFQLEDVKNVCRKLELPFIYETSIFSDIEFLFYKVSEYMLGRVSFYLKSNDVKDSTRISLSNSMNPQNSYKFKRSEFLTNNLFDKNDKENNIRIVEECINGQDKNLNDKDNIKIVDKKKSLCCF